MSAVKRVTPVVTLMNAQAVSSTNTYTSSVQDVSQLDKGTLLISWTGTPTGTLSIQLSVDGVTFKTITPVADDGSSSINPAGSASSSQVGLNSLRHSSLMVSYTNASGSGNMTVKFIGSGS